MNITLEANGVDFIPEVVCKRILQVLVSGGRLPISRRALVERIIDRSYDVLLLRPHNDNGVQNNHDCAHTDAFDVDPENLTPIPGVEQVVGARRNGWHVRKRDLKEGVPVQPFVVSLSSIHAR